MKYVVRDEKTVFNDHYKVVKAQVAYETFNGDEITTKRLAFERGDSAAILLLEKETNSLLLTNQFRYPTCKHNVGWLLEIPAGTIEENESPQQCVIKEVKEELGYSIVNPEHISTFYVSPGGATERVFLFYKEVSEMDKTEKGGGNESENEDIETVKISISELANNIDTLRDAKTILAIQWFLLNKK
ncbi:NUDIX domain-containing protein [Aequorivita viscosa]|uniref:GDP-mannose pyrophosphatase n=1 Tax=Aequorivita viscosa TaxID=797419 RepID=A0A1M6FVP5_9FLAO|nr:NUDIX hydrolase [Aequorivita viscosa]SDW72718.1 ADP-ribose pyrophosphatase [Aequorivita viscosa]SHJ01795.1 ADP-ribose pyrophosphatase [Aequorivita viscosa]